MATRDRLARSSPFWSTDGGIGAAERMPNHQSWTGQLPGDAQTAEFIASWMRSHAAPGVVVVVRHRQLGLHEYLLDEVRRTDPRLKRIHLSDHGTFTLEGEYLGQPRNRFGLLVPVEDVLEAAVQGQGWLHGRPVFQRPSSTHERTLISAARRQQAERG